MVDEYHSWEASLPLRYNHSQSHQPPLPPPHPADLSHSLSDSTPDADTTRPPVYVASGNQTNNETETLSPPVYLYAYVTLASALIFIVGIVGNLLVIVTVARIHKMRTRMNCFLVSLSVADLMVLLVCQPVALMELYGKERWFLGAFMCKLVPFLENTAVHCSALCLLAISAERYVAVCHPLLVVQRRQSHLSTILLTWALSLGLCLPFIFISFLEKAQFSDGSEHWLCRTETKPRIVRIFIVADFVVGMVLPLLAISLFYLVIIWTLAPPCTAHGVRVLRCRCCCGNRRGGDGTMATSTPPSPPSLHTHAPGGPPNNTSGVRKRDRMVRMMVTVVVLFYACLLPLRCLAVWLVFGSPDSLERLGFSAYINLINVCRLLMFLNSAVNPIIYGLMSSKFRTAFASALPAVFGGERRRTSRSSATTRTYPPPPLPLSSPPGLVSHLASSVSSSRIRGSMKLVMASKEKCSMDEATVHHAARV